MLYEILDFFRMPIAIALAVLTVVIIANITIKTTSPKGTAQPWKVSPVEKARLYVKGNLVQAVMIVPVATFVFNEILKAVNNSISSAQSSREFWGQNMY